MRRMRDRRRSIRSIRHPRARRRSAAFRRPRAAARPRGRIPAFQPEQRMVGRLLLGRSRMGRRHRATRQCRARRSGFRFPERRLHPMQVRRRVQMHRSQQQNSLARDSRGIRRPGSRMPAVRGVQVVRVAPAPAVQAAGTPMQGTRWAVLRAILRRWEMRPQHRSEAARSCRQWLGRRPMSARPRISRSRTFI